MSYEVELKFRIAELEEFRGRLEALGARCRGSRRQQDRYFNHPLRDFRRTDEALRIRCDGQENRITYKGPKIDAQTKTRKEIEITFAPGAETVAQLAALLAALGFREARPVAKTRECFELEQGDLVVEIALDHVDGLGTFVELEAAADSEHLDAVRQTVIALAARLGLADGERRSYQELLAQGE